MEVKHLLCVLVIISVTQFVSSLDFGGLDYCAYSNTEECLNKPHLLCNNIHRTKPFIDVEFRNAIINPINVHRENIRLSNHICNMPLVEWNQLLASLAEEAVFRDNFHDYCLVNRAYKNILYFDFTSINSNTDVLSRMRDIINLSDKPTWLNSAYSTGIGCAVNNTRKYVFCLINGIELINSDQSFGYNDECDKKLSVLASTSCSNGEDICDNHLVCGPLQNFSNSNYQKMNFTVKRFILNKLMKEHKTIKWDDDLEYLGEQIVTQRLSHNDKCLAIKNYPNMKAHYFTGHNEYGEAISNVDNLWQANNIANSVGCVMYTRKSEHSWNQPHDSYIYCLYSADETSMWPFYLIAISAIIIIIAILILCGLKMVTKSYVEKCEADKAKKNPSDYADKIDVR